MRFHPKQNKTKTPIEQQQQKETSTELLCVFEEFHIIWYLGLFLNSIFVCDLTQTRMKYTMKHTNTNGRASERESKVKRNE